MRVIQALAATVVLGLLAPSSATAQQRFPDPPAENALYSDAVRIGDLIFLAGVVSRDSDPRSQFRQVFERIGWTLEAMGSSLDRVIDMTTYHVDMHRHISDFIEIKNEYLLNQPTWTAVGIDELYRPEALVEVKIIAAVGGDQ